AAQARARVCVRSRRGRPPARCGRRGSRGRRVAAGGRAVRPRKDRVRAGRVRTGARRGRAASRRPGACRGRRRPRSGAAAAHRLPPRSHQCLRVRRAHARSPPFRRQPGPPAVGGRRRARVARRLGRQHAERHPDRPGVHASRAAGPRLRDRARRRAVAANARPRTALLLPLHRPREPDVERDLRAHRLRARGGIVRARLLLIAAALLLAGCGSSSWHAKVEGPYLQGKLQYWLVRPQGKPRAVVILLHGLARNSGEQLVAWQKHLAAQGDAVIFPRYESIPGDPTARITVAVSSFQAIDKLGNPKVPLVIVGHSRGGRLAVEAASDLHPRLVVAIFPGLLNPSFELPTYLSKIPASTRIYLFSGDKDKSVGASGVREL